MRREILSGSVLVFLTVLSACHPGAFEDGEKATTQDSFGRRPSEVVSTWVEMWNSYDLDQVGELFLTPIFDSAGHSRR